MSLKFASRFRVRNSNIEALRVISMLLVVSHHFSYHNTGDAVVLPRVTRVIIQSIFYSSGKLGVFLFLSITIWFLASRNMTFRDSMRRVWILEKELLFYSLSIMLIRVFLDGDIEPWDVIKAFFPLLSHEWWFMTSYAFLLGAMPFLLIGLRSLTSRQHLRLIVVAIIVAGILPYMPKISGINVYFPSGALIHLTLITVVVTYCRWYVNVEKLKDRGLVLGVIVAADVSVIPLLWYLKNRGIRVVSSLASTLFVEYQRPFSLLVLFIGLPMFLFSVTRKVRHSAIVNLLASSAGAVYVISDSIFFRKVLWSHLFTFDNVADLGGGLLTCVLIVCLVYLSCTLIDLLRDYLFSVLFKHPGALFDRLVIPIVERVNVWIDLLQKKIEKPSESAR